MARIVAGTSMLVPPPLSLVTVGRKFCLPAIHFKSSKVWDKASSAKDIRDLATLQPERLKVVFHNTLVLVPVP
jgi:hypothetical protein